MAAIGIPCFVAGTPILTPKGWRKVNLLTVGDLVMTPTGPAPIIWTGARQLGAADLAAHPQDKPIHFDPGVVGNTARLRLSPQHALPFVQPNGEVVLVRAKHLAEAGQHGVRVAKGVTSVRYHHILLDRHAIILASGAAVESMYPGKQSLLAFPLDARLQIAAAIRRVRPGACGRIVQLGDLSLLYGSRAYPLARRTQVASLVEKDTIKIFSWQSSAVDVAIMKTG